VDLNTVTEFAPAPTTAWRAGDAWLGGGTWLFSQPQPEVTRLLDLRAFGWTPVKETSDSVMIGATCTFAELDRWRPSWSAWGQAAVLARQCCHALLGSFKVHNVATVGGNICLALPAGPMTSFASALDGLALVTRRDGFRQGIPVAGFVTGNNRNQLSPGDLLTHIWIPAEALTARIAFRQVSLSPVGRSAVLVIARRDADGQTVVTVTASTPHPVQLRFPAPPTPEEALDRLAAWDPVYLDDVHGAARWREAMTRRLVAEAIRELTG
jgi:CO/xanthine dehydrogenase FAD-binding subunit